MAIFEINSKGTFLVHEKEKEFYKMLAGGVVFYFLLFFVTKYTIADKSYFLFIIIYLTALYVLLFVFIPITLKIRINKVVRKVQYDANNVLLTTKKENVYAQNDITFSKVKNKFSGFSRARKNGILVKTKTGKEYWIIEDFFNDYEELKKVLKISNI